MVCNVDTTKTLSLCNSLAIIYLNPHEYFIKIYDRMNFLSIFFCMLRILSFSSPSLSLYRYLTLVSVHSFSVDCFRIWCDIRVRPHTKEQTHFTSLFSMFRQPMTLLLLLSIVRNIRHALNFSLESIMLGSCLGSNRFLFHLICVIYLK